MATRIATARDIGLAIRDFLEDRELQIFDDDTAVGWTRVEVIDVSHADAPVLTLDTGQRFAVRVMPLEPVR